MMEGHRSIIRGRQKKPHPSNQDHIHSCVPKALAETKRAFCMQIFHDKTVAALSIVKDKLGLSKGTIIFIKLIIDWFHMMNVKDRYSSINMRDECRQPWTKNCTTFKKLAETCDVISSCAWSGGQGRTQKLTK